MKKLSGTPPIDNTLRLRVRRDPAGGVDVHLAAFGLTVAAPASDIPTDPDRLDIKTSSKKGKNKNGKLARRTGKKVARSRARSHGRKRQLILFLAANPRGSHSLQLAEECAGIQRELKMTANRDKFCFESRWAVSIDELMRHLTELDPIVIHFSGHGGGSAGLVFQDEHGRPQLVSARALAMMVEVAAPHVRLVVLNACYSTVQAEVLRTTVDCIVGMDGAVGDEAARSFAIRFYGAIANGRSIGNAIAQGTAVLAAKQLPAEVLPRCLTRDGIDAHRVVLGRKRPRLDRHGAATATAPRPTTVVTT